jgi:hypothetical protein
MPRDPILLDLIKNRSNRYAKCRWGCGFEASCFGNVSIVSNLTNRRRLALVEFGLCSGASREGFGPSLRPEKRPLMTDTPESVDARRCLARRFVRSTPDCQLRSCAPAWIDVDNSDTIAALKVSRTASEILEKQMPWAG